MESAIKKIPIVAVVGPTASGKTDIAIKLAQRFNGEIVSADSMQIYKKMTIGTAKPTEDEMCGIPHHLIDCVDPSVKFSVADYVKEAHKAVFDIHSAGKLPILVGGTGLYVDSLLNDVDFSDTGSDEAIRDELEAIYKSRGIDALFSMLLECDPKEASIIDRSNPKRLFRALEVCRLTGKTMTEYKENNLKRESRYVNIKIGINYKDRQELYDVINKRVDIMLDKGLEEEARKIFQSTDIQTAYQAIGYKEFFDYFNGYKTLSEAVDEIKLRSRRYAKRQLTWFRRDDDIQWFYKTTSSDNSEIFKNICVAVENFLNICYN